LSKAAIRIRCPGWIRPTRFGVDVDKRTELSCLLSQLALDLTGSSGEMRANCNVTAWLIGKKRLPGSEAECIEWVAVSKHISEQKEKIVINGPTRLVTARLAIALRETETSAILHEGQRGHA